MLVIDLFCGAGGAAEGLHQVWPNATIVGVDITLQPRYPFNFIQADAMTFSLDNADFIWASPPCQRYSYATSRMRNDGKLYPDLLKPIAERLRRAKRPYCIENVVGSEHLMRYPLLLCGSMFNLGVRRHRLFETNFRILRPFHPKCSAQQGLTNVTGHGPSKRWYRTCTVAGKGGNGPKFSYKVWKDAMGIQWMNKKELTQAVPPAYSCYIAKRLLLERKN